MRHKPICTLLVAGPQVLIYPDFSPLHFSEDGEFLGRQAGDYLLFSALLYNCWWTDASVL